MRLVGASTLTVLAPVWVVDRFMNRWSMSKLCVTEPMRTSAIFWIRDASGVLTVKFCPSWTLVGALVIVGRGPLNR